MSRRWVSSGYTLVELMMVVAILGVLVSFALPRVGTTMRTSQEKQCRATRHSIAVAESKFIHDRGIRSVSFQELLDEKYLDKYPRCHAGGTYVWIDSDPNIPNSRYVICSIHE